ncbi:Fe2+-dependent dioxygenase [Luteimonas sp. FXH3W]|uniref:Fe2+-dependent dioxygenase n=1 Tax=Aquilutibacter rugosus TaxID=3115820 RepID=A0ABU7UX26_9GAMM
MLLHIPGVLTADELQAIRHGLESATWTDGRQTVGAQGAQVKRNLQVDADDPARAELSALIETAVRRHPLFFAAALPLRILTPRFNCYQQGGTYGMHVDGAVMQVDAQTHLRSDLSCTVFLSDPDTYQGGELVIRDTYGEHDVKLAAGDAILYPAGSLHQVTPVTQGQRLASFFWVQSMVRDPQQRSLLFDMDTAIQALRQSDADEQAIVQLTGVYHNLLRQWAQV